MSCQKLFAKIDELYEEYLSVWVEVCNIESPTSYKKGVDEVGAYFIKLANKFGWKVEVLEQKVSGNPICITMNENAKKPPIAISGHMDTVHSIGSFSSPLVKIIDGNIILGVERYVKLLHETASFFAVSLTAYSKYFIIVSR